MRPGSLEGSPHRPAPAFRSMAPALYSTPRCLAKRSDRVIELHPTGPTGLPAKPGPVPKVCSRRERRCNARAARAARTARPREPTSTDRAGPSDPLRPREVGSAGVGPREANDRREVGSRRALRLEVAGGTDLLGPLNTLFFIARFFSSQQAVDWAGSGPGPHNL